MANILSPSEIIQANNTFARRLTLLSNTSRTSIMNLVFATADAPSDVIYKILKSGVADITAMNLPAVNELALGLATDLRGQTDATFKKLGQKLGSTVYVPADAVASDAGFTISRQFGRIKEGGRLNSSSLAGSLVNVVNSSYSDSTRALHSEVSREDRLFEDEPVRIMTASANGACDFCQMSAANQGESEFAHTDFHKYCKCTLSPVLSGTNRGALLQKGAEKWQNLFSEASSGLNLGSMDSKSANRAIMNGIRKIVAD